jgi:hypothetical protein
LAVAITLNPGRAYIVASSPVSGSALSSGTARRRSERMETSASCTSGRQRVTSSTLATQPFRMAVSTGDGTSASGCGPRAISSA